MDIARLLAPDHADAPILERSGVWLPEEEGYMLALIECFLSGLLATVEAGTSLRSYVAGQLHCAPMRVSKKIASLPYPSLRSIGRCHFEPRAVRDADVATLQRLVHAETLFQRAVEPLAARHVAPAIDEKVVATAKCETRGLWFHYEQRYAAKLIEYFVQGALALPPGTTLRGFLAEKLCCSPMRVSKKLATGSIAGRAIPRRLGTAVFVTAAMDAELAQLRKDCFAHKTQHRR
ncbi:hypothetical protein SPRG_21726 [Saprolegnia parasitica CBS 223.65]|uniref:Uncharacterized protein n=1 Tax=Saprolegnia parasitica (strain CBS 223.65) TaxID=695850 RepID=A0A067BVI2_SAPPC|nr:hypothetical protein SPRG_21726 [Saprolegnia parasitica CBS 223.65]KDO18291.1 hypothetical protein SPRG_21726 [Saprolegnia parasitica CBS 223.65]|eukprot:XP_012210999.1 hypothetical protein SPRG_21726 [Saprolegnia parasitica CBS 223.65]